MAATRFAWLFLAFALSGVALGTPLPQDAEEDKDLTPEEKQKAEVVANLTALVLNLMDTHGQEDCFRRLVCQLEKEKLADPETFKTEHPNPPAILTLLSDDFPQDSIKDQAVLDRYFYYYVAKQAGLMEGSDCEQIYTCSLPKEEVLKEATKLSGEFSVAVCQGASCNQLETEDQSSARKLLDNIESAETEECFKRLICELEQENSDDVEAFNTKYPIPPNILVFVDNEKPFENHPIEGTSERFQAYHKAQDDGLLPTSDCPAIYACSLTQEKVLEDMYALPWK